MATTKISFAFGGGQTDGNSFLQGGLGPVPIVIADPQPGTLGLGTFPFYQRGNATAGTFGGFNATPILGGIGPGNVLGGTDGNLAVFHTAAHNLLALDTDDANTVEDVYLFNRTTEVSTAVSLTRQNGSQTTQPSFNSVISADGNWIAFQSQDLRLVNTQGEGTDAAPAPGIPNDNDIFLYNVATGNNQLVSRVTGLGTSPVNADNFLPVINSNGQRVAFVSSTDNVGVTLPFSAQVLGDTDDLDIFVFDRISLDVTQASVRDGQAPATATNTNGYATNPDINGDGNLVVFEYTPNTTTDFLTGDALSSSGIITLNGGFVAPEIYIRNLTTRSTELISTRSNGSISLDGGSSFNAAISPSGEWVAFVSTHTNLVTAPDNNGALPDIFLLNLNEGPASLRRVSVDSNGVQANGPSWNPRVGDNGVVVFTSAANNLDLAVADTNNVADVFEFDSATGTTVRVSVTNAVPPGQANNGSDNGSINQNSTISFDSNASNLIVGSPTPPNRFNVYADDAPEISASIKIIKTAGDATDGETLVTEAGMVTYTYEVTNDGAVVLANVKVVDDNGTPTDTTDDITVDTIGSLSPGTTRTLTNEIEVTEDVTNIATATGTTPSAGTVSSTDDAVVDVIAPAIEITKTAGNATDGTTLETQPGNVTYTYVVENTGDVDLTDVMVVDDSGTPGDTSDDFTVMFVDDNGTPGDTSDDTEVSMIDLAVGEKATATETVEVLEGTVTNTATATGTTPIDTTVEASDDAVVEVIPAGLNIIKTAGDAPNGDTLVIQPGEVTYTYVVSNIGEIIFPNVRVVDDNGTPGNANDDFVVGEFTNFAPGAEETLTRTLDITEDVTNVATATGTTLAGIKVTATDDAVVEVSNAGILLTKTAGDAANDETLIISKPGDVTYNYRVINTGSEILNNVTIVDDAGTPEDEADDIPVGTIDILAVGAERTFSNTIEVTEAATTNIATASGTTGDGVTISDTDDAVVVIADRFIKIVKTAGDAADGATLTIPEAGDVQYTYVVNNIGEVELTDITVTDDNGTPGKTSDDLTIGTIESLAPGTSRTLTETIEVSEDLTNIATVMGTTPDGIEVSDTDDAVVEVGVPQQRIPGKADWNSNGTNDIVIQTTNLNSGIIYFYDPTADEWGAFLVNSAVAATPGWRAIAQGSLDPDSSGSEILLYNVETAENVLFTPNDSIQFVPLFDAINPDATLFTPGFTPTTLSDINDDGIDDIIYRGDDGTESEGQNLWRDSVTRQFAPLPGAAVTDDPSLTSGQFFEGSDNVGIIFGDPVTGEYRLYNNETQSFSDYFSDPDQTAPGFLATGAINLDRTQPDIGIFQTQAGGLVVGYNRGTDEFDTVFMNVPGFISLS